MKHMFVSSDRTCVVNADDIEFCGVCHDEDDNPDSLETVHKVVFKSGDRMTVSRQAFRELIDFIIRMRDLDMAVI